MGIKSRIAIFVIALIAMWGITAVYGHHTGVPCGPETKPGRAVCLPYADGSAAVRQLQSTKTLTFCFDFRARNYPNFRSQVIDVNTHQGREIGISWVEIAGTYATAGAAKLAGCQVWHSMPDNHGCSGCGAWVHYLNWPVIIEYRYQAGYIDWRTTIAHEQIHIYGLHEHYNDGSGISCYRPAFGVWAHGYEYGVDPGGPTDSPTVMDCAVGPYLQGDWLTAYDLRYVCENIDPFKNIFSGCMPEEPLSFPFWDGGRWIYDEGGRANSWSWEHTGTPGGIWYYKNVAVFVGCDPAWGGWIIGPYGDNMLPAGAPVFWRSLNLWATVPFQCA